MMSFLRRLALKAVIAAKKTSVIDAAGPLQHGVGCQDGANKMIKSIQYFAEADQNRVLVALDLKAAFQNVSRRHMLHSLRQHDPDLATVFSQWYTGTTTHCMHYDGLFLRTHPCQQRNRPGLPTVTLWLCGCGRPHFTIHTYPSIFG